MLKTPITVVTGHLGSGKTTLVQKILNLFPEKKILVIENEFGEIGIDGEILASNDNALVELNAGCVCCNIQSDLEDILQKFIAEKKNFDHIIIEATGVANPAKIARQFIVPNYLSNFFKLQSVLCVIDSIHYEKHRELPEFELQVLTSDSYYVSKLTNNDQSLVEKIMSGLALDIKNTVDDSSLQKWFVKESFFNLDDQVPLKGGHTHYQKISFELEGEFDPFTLENCLNVLFLQYSGRIFRSKGILHFRKTPYPVIFQGVFDSISFDEFKGDPIKNKKNNLILIGKDLDEDTIRASLKNCLAEKE